MDNLTPIVSKDDRIKVETRAQEIKKAQALLRKFNQVAKREIVLALERQGINTERIAREIKNHFDKVKADTNNESAYIKTKSNDTMIKLFELILKLTGDIKGAEFAIAQQFNINKNNDTDDSRQNVFESIVLEVSNNEYSR